MRFDLKVRPTEAGDPSGDDLEMYLDALREDISGVRAVV